MPNLKHASTQPHLYYQFENFPDSNYIINIIHILNEYNSFTISNFN